MVTSVLRPRETSPWIAAKLILKNPFATNEPVVAPSCAVLMQGVPGTRELQKPFPHPPEFGTVLELFVSTLSEIRARKYEPTRYLLYCLQPERTRSVGHESEL